MRVCEFPDCGRPYKSRGLCQAHAKQRRLGRELRPVSDGIMRNLGAVCAFGGCSLQESCKGLCRSHYRAQREGRELAPLRQRGPRGAGSIDRAGYRNVYSPGHPNARSGGYLFEHTLVMSRELGRPLLPGETVHHLNGDRADNRLENLELWMTKQPYGQRVSDQVEWAAEILGLYAPERLA